MVNLFQRLLVVNIVLGVVIPAFAQRTAGDILKEFESIQMPSFDQERYFELGPEAYDEQLQVHERRLLGHRAELAIEFYTSFPLHERATEMLLARWESLDNNAFRDFQTLIDETTATLADSEVSLKVKSVAAYRRARGMGRQTEFNPEQYEPALKIVAEYSPDDRPVIDLLMYAGDNTETHPEWQTQYYRRVVDDYPESRDAFGARGHLRRVETLGKPFHLEFQDALSGRTITLPGDYAGQIVILDFWATWCPPCLAKMPKLKALYEKYHNRGLEIIGISLDLSVDQGGLDRLKKYVEKEGLPWPQYYQEGDTRRSDFSGSWGVDALPIMFVIDREGNLYSARAAGRVEEVLLELLK